MNVATPDIDEAEPLPSLAAILARGVIRLRQRDIDAARNPQESSPACLDLVAESRPRAVDGSESRRKGKR